MGALILNQGAINVAAVSNLTSNLNDASLNNGTLVSVTNLNLVYYLNKTSTATIDGDNVVATLSGSGRWLKFYTSAGAQSDGYNIATNENYSDIVYGNLSTVGPSTTITVPSSGKIIVSISAAITKSSGGAGNIGYASFELSGANTLAANDDNSIQSASSGGGLVQTSSRSLILTGLTPGSTTITMKYKVDSFGVNFEFKNRSLIAIPV